MTLPLDVSRCAGRYDFSDDPQWCPERNTCKRYLAFIELDRAAGIPDYRGIPVSMAVPNCGHKIEHNEAGDPQC